MPMNYQRRKMRPNQPAIPSVPNKGTQAAGKNMSAKGTVGSGSPSGDHCKGAMGTGHKGKY
jgi:hypothetical protein